MRLDFKIGKGFAKKHLPKEEIQITIKTKKKSVYNYSFTNKQEIFQVRKEGIKSWYCISTHGYAQKK